MFRIKHIETGFYFQPTRNGNNLSKVGKVYSKKGSAEKVRKALNVVTLQSESGVLKEFPDTFERVSNSGYIKSKEYKVSPDHFTVEELLTGITMEDVIAEADRIVGSLTKEELLDWHNKVQKA